MANLEVDLGEGQGVGLVGILEVKVGVKALRVLAFQVVSGTEELLEVAQVAIKVEQEVAQEEAVLAWEVFVSEKEKQMVGELVAVKKQMCHQKEIYSSLRCFCDCFSASESSESPLSSSSENSSTSTPSSGIY